MSAVNIPNILSWSRKQLEVTILNKYMHYSKCYQRRNLTEYADGHLEIKGPLYRKDH